MKMKNKLGTAMNYKRTENSFRSFLNDTDIPFEAITEDLIYKYELWLNKRDLTRNSISFYMRILRAVYNKAINENIIPESNPFRHVYTGIDQTRKRAIGLETIIKLKKLKLDDQPSLTFARDLFLFSFYTRGMAFIDIAYLKKTHIRNNAIQYTRHKTGQFLCIRLEKCIIAILNRYINKSSGSPYLFPIITSMDENIAYKQYKSALGYYNKLLRKLSVILNITCPLSSYTARHTWATIARNKNIPLSVISAGMGHTSQITTQIYLASLENSDIDEANRLIISELM